MNAHNFLFSFKMKFKKLNQQYHLSFEIVHRMDVNSYYYVIHM